MQTEIITKKLEPYTTLSSKANKPELDKITIRPKIVVSHFNFNAMLIIRKINN